MRNELIKDEGGAVAVMLALLMVVLLGFAAVVVDVGALYWEKAQLQNGADAAALGVAQKCAVGPCVNMTSLATELASGNANDNAAAAVPVLTANAVTVTTSTRTAGGGHELAHFFAPILGISSTEVGAKASAAWGSPKKGPAMLPLADHRTAADPNQYRPILRRPYRSRHSGRVRLAGDPGHRLRPDRGHRNTSDSQRYRRQLPVELQRGTRGDEKPNPPRTHL
jgi:hypothetical protein